MSSIFQKPTVRPNLGHNGFDLSRRRLFTSPCGMLLPIFWDFASPGEKYKCNSSIYVRTEAISTAAMMRLKAHVDWFFVPVTQLYSLWNEFFNGVDDNMSSIFSITTLEGNKNGNSLPYYNIKNFISGPIGNSIDKFFVESPTTGLVTGTKYQPSVDETGTPYLFNARRLWDMLGFGSLSNTILNNSQNQRPISLFPYLAYHKIFHSKFLVTDWFKNDPSLYNVDKYYSGPIDEHTAFRIMSTIHYRPYRTDYFTNILPSPFYSTAFANFINNNLTIQTSDLRSAVNNEGIVGNLLSNDTNDVITSPTSARGATLKQTNSNYITAGDIRATFALDKLLRVTAFAGSHYEDQTLAHFGHKMPEGISKEAYDLGSQTADISINEVVATSQTNPDVAGGQLGDIAGKGFAVTDGGKPVDFTAPCHGILMAIYSIEPIPEYASVVQERKNFYCERFDFYHPEFDNVGMQPFDTPLLYNSNAPISDKISGWTYRYSELKSNFNVVNESLWDTSRASWQGNKQMPYLSGVASTGNAIEMSKFNVFYIIPQYTNSIFKYPYKSYANLSENDKFILGPQDGSSTQTSWRDPSLLSSVCYSGDNFINNVDIQCFKVSPMSVHSLPKIY